MNGSTTLVALEETGSETSTGSETDQTEAETPTDGTDPVSTPDGGSTDSVSQVEADPVEYETIALDSGNLRIIHSMTYGDILVSFCILLVLFVKIGKWGWEATK